MTITLNAARCDGCGTTIISRHRWDYVSCKCGALAVDGGRDYLRRATKGSVPWTELSTSNNGSIEGGGDMNGPAETPRVATGTSRTPSDLDSPR